MDWCRGHENFDQFSEDAFLNKRKIKRQERFTWEMPVKMVSVLELVKVVLHQTDTFKSQNSPNNV